MQNKLPYKCEICGTGHSNILDRAKCEIACAEKAEAEARKAAEAKKKEEQLLRKEAVDEAIEHSYRLVSEYIKDYGYYEYEDKGDNENFYWPSRLWHTFLI